jgi:cell division protein FtsZ
MNQNDSTSVQEVPSEVVASPCTAEQVAPLTHPAKPVIRVIGVGNAGTNLVDVLVKKGFPAGECAVLNSDLMSLTSSVAGQKITIGTKQNRGLGCGGDAERGRAGAEGCASEIAAFCKDATAVVIVCGLGGGTGTGAAPVVARHAKTAGAIVLSIPAIPFECEGALRRRLAEAGFKDLRQEADLVLPFYNDRAVSPNAPKTLLDTYKSANEMLAGSIRCVCNAFTAGSVMGLPFSDICILMRDRSEDCMLVTAEAEGTDRATVAADALMAHPVLQGGNLTLADADAVAVCVLGGPSLGIGEVNKVVERTSVESASSPFLMGAAIHLEMDDRVAVVLIIGKVGQASAETHRTTQPARDPWTGDVSEPAHRPKSRHVPPPPEMTQERARQLHEGARARKVSPRMRQAQLALDIVSKGRFDRSEPTIHKGEDLDIPTYVRRGIPLN